MKKIHLILILLLCSTCLNITFGEDIQLIVDGENITQLMNPVIENNRTLVPIKFVSDAIDAEVIWHETTRTVEVFKDNHYMKLWIDNRLIQIDEKFYISDVAPKIINDRTFVPIRLLSNGLNIEVTWDGANRHVQVDSLKDAEFENFYSDTLQVDDMIKGQVDVLISETTTGQFTKLFLIDPQSGKGVIVASSTSDQDKLIYTPKVEDTGQRLLVMAKYDSQLNFLSGALKEVTINVQPSIAMQATFSGSIKIDQSLNFIPDYITYEISNLSSEKTTIISERDPYESYTYSPSFDEAGQYRIRVIAYTPSGQHISSDYQYGEIQLERSLFLNVTTGQIIDGPVNLIAKRNFDVDHTTFYLDDKVLHDLPWGSYEWFPNETDIGDHTLKVAVTSKGKTYTSEAVQVTVLGQPKLILSGIGPSEVVTGEKTLSVKTNVDLEISYYLTNELNGQKRLLGSGDQLVYKPLFSDHGPLSIQALGDYNGQTIYSEKINFEYFDGKLYGPKAIIEKDEFMDFASRMALDSYKKTGMSAALQTAQAILETAWGQRLPVDKYTGEFSYNLFGIKGHASNGSVTSNTWEVYNGKTYRVDAEFRAYNTVLESWNDHKRILLELSRYEDFRDVMYDSSLGAYAIRRCGYATDPKYPRKLIDIIKRYNLSDLDEITIDLK